MPKRQPSQWPISDEYTVDLHPPMDMEGARVEVDQLIDDAFMDGKRYVRIVHGKGTGKLRKAIHAGLAKHRLVKRYRTAPPRSGDDGATEVELHRRDAKT